MAYKVLQTTALLKTPDANAPIVTILMEGETVADAGEQQGGFVKVKHPASPDPGWVVANDVQKVGDAPRPPVEKADFVSACILAEHAVNALPATAPWYVAADFVIARAIIETNIANLGPQIPGSDGVGPLQVTTKEWAVFLASPLGIKGGFKPDDRDNPTAQTTGAAYRMFTDAKAISDAKAAKGVGSATDPFLPSYLDVFHAYLTDSPTAAVAILDAGKGEKLNEVLKGLLTDAQIADLFKARGRFTGSADAPKTVAEFATGTEAALNDALKQAFDLQKEFVPEELPQIQQGEAPWFDVAQKEEKAGITEPNSRILEYFKATDLRPLPTSTKTPWCGAFAAFCMAQSGNAAAAASIPKASAQAAQWKGWGSQLPLKSTSVPTGAVVVLSPGEGTGGSGHVGFFVGYSHDGKFVQLLGGNQSNSVKKSNFPVSQIAAICWLDLQPTIGSAIDGVALSTTKISQAAFDLIVSFEVSSEAYYNAKLRAPTWPGVSSGVTVGIGYDVGQTKAATVKGDWENVIPASMLDPLLGCVGITGAPAKSRAQGLKGVVDIDYDKAIDVFGNCSIPRWITVVEDTLQNTDKLNGDCLGMLVSLTFNRGAGGYNSSKSRFREMVGIKNAMAAEQFDRIPDLIRSMKRLWLDVPGLLVRRDKEADFFALGLAKMHAGGGA